MGKAAARDSQKETVWQRQLRRQAESGQSVRIWCCRRRAEKAGKWAVRKEICVGAAKGVIKGMAGAIPSMAVEVFVPRMLYDLTLRWYHNSNNPTIEDLIDFYEQLPKDKQQEYHALTQQLPGITAELDNPHSKLQGVKFEMALAQARVGLWQASWDYNCAGKPASEQP